MTVRSSRGFVFTCSPRKVMQWRCQASGTGSLDREHKLHDPAQGLIECKWKHSVRLLVDSRDYLRSCICWLTIADWLITNSHTASKRATITIRTDLLITSITYNKKQIFFPVHQATTMRITALKPYKNDQVSFLKSLKSELWTRNSCGCPTVSLHTGHNSYVDFWRINQCITLTAIILNFRLPHYQCLDQVDAGW